ncbi:hypothetical protein ACFE04_008421 [Oxalis oulophora]
MYRDLQSFLSSIIQVTNLTINSSSIQHVAMQLLYSKECLPFKFKNLESLVIHHDGYFNLNMAVIALLLQGSKGLKKLLIKREFVSTDEDVQICGSLIRQPKNLLFLHELELEEVEIDMLTGNNVTSLVEFLLENAKMLKKMTVFSGKSMPTKIAQKLIAAALARGADFRSQGNKMVLELKP